MKGCEDATERREQLSFPRWRSWSRRRRVLGIVLVAVVVALAIVLPLVFVTAAAPTDPFAYGISPGAVKLVEGTPDTVYVPVAVVNRGPAPAPAWCLAEVDRGPGSAPLGVMTQPTMVPAVSPLHSKTVLLLVPLSGHVMPTRAEALCAASPGAALSSTAFVVVDIDLAASG
jgi:hypothetical protein